MCKPIKTYIIILIFIFKMEFVHHFKYINQINQYKFIIIWYNYLKLGIIMQIYLLKNNSIIINMIKGQKIEHD